MSLYEDIGGAPAITAALDAFYARVLDDARLSGYFDGVDMAHLKTSVGAYFAMALGGPSDYRGRDLRTAHSRLRAMGLDDGGTDAFLSHFREVLESFGVPPTTTDAVVAVAEGSRREVLDA